MSDLEAAYRSRVSAAEEERLRRVLDEGVRMESAGALDPMDKLQPPKPEEKKPAKKGPDYKGLEVAGETAFEGIKNFGQGLANFIVPPTGQTPGEVLKERGAGLGQSALGIMQFIMALPAGVGANVRAALEHYVPGMESAPAIKEGETAGRIRATLGAPSLAFDPKMKEAIQRDPEGVLKALNAPITYGELFDIATQFAVGGVMGKGVKAAPITEAPKAPLALPPGPSKALPPGVYEAGPSPLSVSLTDRLVSDFAHGRRYPDAETVLMESIARRRGEGPRDLGSEAPIELPGAETRPKTPLGAPERAAEAEIFPEDVLPSGELTQTLDMAQRRAEKAIQDQFDAAAKEVGARVEEAVAKAEDRPHPKEAPIVKYRKEAAGIEDALPPVPEGHVRLWRGNRPDEVGKNRGFTNDLPGIALPFRDAYGGKLSYVDVLAADLAKYENKAGAAPGAEFGVPEDIAARARIVEAKPRIVEPPTEAERAALAADREQIARELTELQKRGVDPGTLSSMAIGAAVGGSEGDTPEERILKAFLGAGIGALVSKRLTKSVMDAYKSSRFADETGALNLGAFGKKQQAVPYQPNYMRMKTTPSTEQYIRTLYEAIKTDIAKQGRGIRSHVQMDAEAIAMLKDGRMTPDRILNFQRGTTLNDSQLKAARHIAMRSVEEADALVERAFAGEIIDQKDVTRAIAVSGAINVNVRSAIKETGRALSSMRAMASSEGAAPLKFHSERIEMVAERMRAGATVDEIMATWRSLKSIQQRSTFARLYYAIPEALLEAFYGSILAGPAIVKNAASILFVMPMEIMSRSAAAYMPRNLWKLAKSDPRAVSPAEGPMGVVAFVQAGIEQLRMLRHFDEIRAQTDALVARGGSRGMEMELHGLEALGQISRDAGHSNLAKAMDFLDTGYSIAPGIMRATDGMSKAIGGRIQTQWEAMQRARVEGLRGSDYWSRVDEYKQDYTKLPAESLENIADAREHVTFTKNLEGRITGAAQAGPRDPWLNLLWRLNFATFVRTPARIAEFATEYTPILNGLAKHFWQEWSQGGTKAAVAEGRIATGALLIGTFGTMEAMGLITPPEMDSNRKKMLTDAGRPPGMWWDHVSQKHRSYEGFEPLSTMIGMGATLSQYMRQLPETDGDLLFIAAVLSWIDTINAKTFTESYSEFADMVFNPSGDARVEKSMSYIRKKLASFLPLGAALKEVERVVDPTERRAIPSGAFDTRQSGGALAREWYALKDTYRERIPGLSDAKDENGNDLVPALRNQFTGEPEINSTFPWNPWRAREGNDAPWAREIVRLRGAGLTPLDEWIGRRAGPDVGLTDKPTPPGIRLSTSEVDRLRVLHTSLRLGGKTLTENMNELVQTPTYQAQSDITKKQWIQAEWAEYRIAAEQALMRERPQLAGAYAERRGMSQIEKAPPERQPDLTRQLQQMLQNLGKTLGR